MLQHEGDHVFSNKEYSFVELEILYISVYEEIIFIIRKSKKNAQWFSEKKYINIKRILLCRASNPPSFGIWIKFFYN